MNDFVLESLVDDDLDIQRVLASLLQRQERSGRSGLGVVRPAAPSTLSPSHDAPQADLLLIDLTPAREGDAQRCRVLRPRSELSALILKVVDGDNAENADDRQDEWGASPVSTGDLFAKALELTEAHQSPAASSLSAEPPRGRTAHFANWTLDLALHVLSSDSSQPIALPHTEFSLLLAFLDHPRQVLRRDELVACTRATTRHLSVRTVDVYVSRLRRRLAASRRSTPLIETRHRQGYVFNANPVFV